MYRGELNDLLVLASHTVSGKKQVSEGQANGPAQLQLTL